MAISELKGITFPFKKGTTSFPKVSEGETVLWDSVNALFSTAKGERVMRPTLGLNVHAYVFDGFDALLRARIAREVRFAIDRHERRIKVLSVTTLPGRQEGEVIIDIAFQIADRVLRDSFTIGAPNVS